MNASTLARYYLNGPERTLSPDEIAAWQDHVDRLFGRIPALVHWVRGQPYRTPGAMFEDFAAGEVKVSIDNAQPQYLGYAGCLKARAVHDWCHYMTGAGFDLKGEREAAKYEYLTLVMESPRVAGILKDVIASEVIGQAAVVCHTGNFPTQRVVLGYGAFL